MSEFRGYTPTESERRISSDSNGVMAKIGEGTKKFVKKHPYLTAAALTGSAIAWKVDRNYNEEYYRDGKSGEICTKASYLLEQEEEIDEALEEGAGLDVLDLKEPRKITVEGHLVYKGQIVRPIHGDEAPVYLYDYELTDRTEKTIEVCSEEKLGHGEKKLTGIWGEDIHSEANEGFNRKGDYLFVPRDKEILRNYNND